MARSLAKTGAVPRPRPRLGHSQPVSAGLRQGADSGIYGARPEAVLGIVPLPGTSLFTQQDVAFRRMAQVMPPENRVIFWEKG